MLISVCKYIEIDPITLCKTFWDVQAWLHIWSPMQQVTIHYQDAFNQEIIMYVDRDGDIEKNRTFRFLTEKQRILFFSPQPPPMMSLHRGEWLFEQCGIGCNVIAKRDFKLIKHNIETNKDFLNREAIFVSNFYKRLEQILIKFKVYFQGEANV